jgi:hypothetical protein
VPFQQAGTCLVMPCPCSCVHVYLLESIFIPRIYSFICTDVACKKELDLLQECRERHVLPGDNSPCSAQVVCLCLCLCLSVSVSVSCLSLSRVCVLSVSVRLCCICLDLHTQHTTRARARSRSLALSLSRSLSRSPLSLSLSLARARALSLSTHPSTQQEDLVLECRASFLCPGGTY